MITLDTKVLLGGGLSARATQAGKIGTPAKAPAVDLDASLLMTREGQARGAKIGRPDKAQAIDLDAELLLARDSQGRGAKIGDSLKGPGQGAAGAKAC